MMQYNIDHLFDQGMRVAHGQRFIKMLEAEQDAKQS